MIRSREVRSIILLGFTPEYGEVWGGHGGRVEGRGGGRWRGRGSTYTHFGDKDLLICNFYGEATEFPSQFKEASDFFLYSWRTKTEMKYR